MKYSDEDLCSTVTKALNDEELKLKLKKASKRIQKEDRISKVSNEIIDYIEKLGNSKKKLEQSKSIKCK